MTMFQGVLECDMNVNEGLFLPLKFHSRPMDGPDKRTKERLQAKQQQQQQRKQQRARSRPQRERKSSRSGGSDRHMADVKIELGPMPFDPKY